MFEAVFNLPSSNLSQIPTFNTCCANPYHRSAHDAIQYMKQFTFPNIAPTIQKCITEMNEDDDIICEDLSKSNENITVSLARNNYHIFILYRGTVGKNTTSR